MGRPRAINRMQKIYKKLDREEKEKKRNITQTIHNLIRKKKPLSSMY